METIFTFFIAFILVILSALCIEKFTFANQEMETYGSSKHDLGWNKGYQQLTGPYVPTSNYSSSEDNFSGFQLR